MPASQCPTGPARLEPDRGADQHGQADQQQAGAVAAVLGVEVAGGGRLPADGAGGPADAVREPIQSAAMPRTEQAERRGDGRAAAPPP